MDILVGSVPNGLNSLGGFSASSRIVVDHERMLSRHTFSIIVLRDRTQFCPLSKRRCSHVKWGDLALQLDLFMKTRKGSECDRTLHDVV